MTPPPVFGKVYMASQLTDAFARKFYYLRLSITDVCNFRCTYCLPDGYKPGGVTNNGFLTVDEIRRVTRAFASLGTEKVSYRRRAFITPRFYRHHCRRG